MPHPPSAPGSATGRLTPGTPTSAAQGLKGPGFGLLRRESGFSIASLAASLPIAVRPRSNVGGEEAGQQLITVSRAGSLKSRSSAKSLKIRVGDGDESDSEESDRGDESATTNEDESEADGEEEAADEDIHGGGSVGDARSIRSFENMLSASKQRPKSARERKSLSDRLATVSALAGIKVRFFNFAYYNEAQRPSRGLAHLILGDPHSSNHSLQRLDLRTLQDHPVQFLRCNLRCA